MRLATVSLWRALLSFFFLGWFTAFTIWVVLRIYHILFILIWISDVYMILLYLVQWTFLLLNSNQILKKWGSWPLIKRLIPNQDLLISAGYSCYILKIRVLNSLIYKQLASCLILIFSNMTIFYWSCIDNTFLDILYLGWLKSCYLIMKLLLKCAWKLASVCRFVIKKLLKFSLLLEIISTDVSFYIFRVMMII